MILSVGRFLCFNDTLVGIRRKGRSGRHEDVNYIERKYIRKVVSVLDENFFRYYQQSKHSN